MPRKQNKGVMSPEHRQKMSNSVRNAMRKTDENGQPITKSVQQIKAFLEKCNMWDLALALKEIEQEALRERECMEKLRKQFE